MKNLHLTNWLLKVRNALAEQDEAKRNSMLQAADGFRNRSNQWLALRRAGTDNFQTRESPNQFVQLQRVGSRARE